LDVTFDPLLEECEWAPVKCPNKGCAESPLRKDLAEHGATCGSLQVSCSHCGVMMGRQLLAEHEERCGYVKVDCPNAGCSVQQVRGIMNWHRARCEHEEVTCPCPGCDARLLRRKVNEHMEATHRGSAEMMKTMARKIAQLEERDRILRSEQCHAAASPTTWVFNWRADCWGTGRFDSESHLFGQAVEGMCTLQYSSGPDRSHFIGFKVEGVDKCRLHASFSVLDTHDKTLCEVFEIGTATEPVEHEFADGLMLGTVFTPTAEEKAQSVRADGSIRMRAVVRLFLDAAA